jgi:hypothetical protein
MKETTNLQLRNLLDKIKIIDYKYSLLKNNDRFNIFSLLRDKGDEVNLHSRFIGEMLSPLGSHNCGDTFLKLFIELFQAKAENPDTTKTKVFIEKHISKISDDYTTGGRIDLLIKNFNDQNFVIENKIFADDQPKQLLRYYNYDNEASIIYLTLFGTDPTDQSLGISKKVKEKDLPLKRDDIIKMSYKRDISNWIDLCIEKTATKPAIRETLIQYKKLINNLTGNITTMEERLELFSLLGENENIISAKKIVDNWIHIRWHTEWEFWNDLEKHITGNSEFDILNEEKYSDKRLNNAIHDSRNRNPIYGLQFKIGEFKNEALKIMIVRGWGRVFYKLVSNANIDELYQLIKPYCTDDLSSNNKPAPGKVFEPILNFESFNDNNTLQMSNVDYRGKMIQIYWNQIIEFINIVKGVL